MLRPTHLDKHSKIASSDKMIRWVTLIFCIMVFCVNAQQNVTINLEDSSSPDLFVYQANQKIYRFTYLNGTNAVDLSTKRPFLSWSWSGYASTRVTSSWALVSGTTNKVDFTFSPASLNTNGGPFLYEVGYENTNGSVEVWLQGDLTIYPSPYASGVGAINFGTNLNWGLYNWVGLPNWVLTGTIQGASSNHFSVATNHATIFYQTNGLTGTDLSALTNIVSNSTGLTFTNSGRQAYATALFATGTPIYVDLGATGVVGDARLALTYNASTRTITGSVSTVGLSTGTPIYVETGISNNVIQGQTNLLSSTNSGRQAFLTLNSVVASGAVDSITSAMIVDSTIVNADISSSAAITATKIANTGLTQATTFTGDVAGVWSALTLINGSVTSAKILDGTITNDDIGANAAISPSKIAGTAVTASVLSSTIFATSNYPSALLIDGSRASTSNQNAGGFSYTNLARVAGTNGAINLSTRAADSTTVWTDFNADLFDGYDSVQLRTNLIVQGQTGYVSASNANRQVYLTVTGLAAQTDLTIATNALATNVLLKLNNLSDVASAATARSNLGLGTAATNAYTNSIFNASQISDFSVATNDPTSAQILIVNSSIYTPTTVGGDGTLSAAGAFTITNPLAVSKIDTNSLNSVFATDVELNNASNALRTTADILATQQWAIAQYPNAVLRDGSRSMSGYLNMGEYSITNVTEIRGFAGAGRYLNLEDGDSDTNEWSSLNVGFIQGYRASSLVKNTGSQRMTGPLVVTDSVLIHTNLHLAATNSLGSELLVNGTFAATNGDGTVTAWTLTSASYDSGQKIYVAPGATATIAYSNASPLTAYKSYQVSFLADIDTGTNPTTFRVTLGGYTQTYANISDGTFTFQGRLENTNNISFAITPGTNTFFLDTVSIKEITQGDAWFADDVTVGGALRVAENAVFASNVTAASFTGVFGGSSTSFVEIAGDTMLGGLTNNSGFYGNGIGITNLPAGSSSAFVLKAGDTMTGALTISNSAPAAYWRDNDGTNAIVIGVSGTYGPFISLVNNYPNAAPMLAIDGNTNLQRRLSAATAFTVMDSGNDGSGSGFDADLLDGLSSTAFVTNNIILSNSTVVGSASKFNFVNPSALTIAGGTANVTMATSGSAAGNFTNHQPILEWYAPRDNTTNNNMLVSSVPATSYLSTYTATSIEECIMFWQTAATTSQDRQRAFSISMPVAFGTTTTNIQIKMRHNQSTNGIFVTQFFYNNQTIAFTNKITAANSTETKNMATAGTFLTNLPEGLKLYGNIIGTSQSTNTANQAQLGLMDFRIMR